MQSSGKNFLLCRGAKHRNLKFSQLKRSFESDGSLHFTYNENRSKNRCGGFNQLNVENKVVHQYQDLPYVFASLVYQQGS